MRTPALALLVVAAGLTVAAGSATSESHHLRATSARSTAQVRGTGAARMNVGAGISIALPAGWHVVRGWLSDVIDPAPRLAVGSFAARLSRHTCVCGMPNVRNFPRAGAFLFVWEPLRLPPGGLQQFPRRPRHFLITAGGEPWFECAGPHQTVVFRDRRRAFQVEIYLGPSAGAKQRAQLAAALDSLAVH